MPKLVYPSPDLPEGSDLPGVGSEGAEVSSELAAEWIKAGVATDKPHKAPIHEPPVTPAPEETVR